MDKSEKIEAYFDKDSPYREGINILRELALKTELTEAYKWGSPVYTIAGKNVLGLMAFKSHFGIWFFNGVFLSDPMKILENAQEGKTKAMRHWKMTSNAFDRTTVLAYMNEAIANQKKGLRLLPERKKRVALKIPDLLQNELDKNNETLNSFTALPPYKQRDYCEYITTAKREKTKLSRLAKIVPMIDQGIGLNDKYQQK